MREEELEEIEEERELPENPTVEDLIRIVEEVLNITEDDILELEDVHPKLRREGVNKPKREKKSPCEQPTKCSECGKVFTSKGNLMEHYIRAHTNFFSLPVATR